MIPVASHLQVSQPKRALQYRPKVPIFFSKRFELVDGKLLSFSKASNFWMGTFLCFGIDCGGSSKRTVQPCTPEGSVHRTCRFEGDENESEFTAGPLMQLLHGSWQAGDPFQTTNVAGTGTPFARAAELDAGRLANALGVCTGAGCTHPVAAEGPPAGGSLPCYNPVTPGNSYLGALNVDPEGLKVIAE